MKKKRLVVLKTESKEDMTDIKVGLFKEPVPMINLSSRPHYPGLDCWILIAASNKLKSVTHKLLSVPV